MSEIPVCWRCGAGLENLSLPFGRLDECPACHVQVHVCRMCRFFDPAVVRACREEGAEEVKAKDRANFCDYFSPGNDAFDARFKTAEQQANAQLDALFGAGSDSNNDPPAASPAEDLFKKD